ncbi:alkene reductase [Luteimonas sp. MC1750]|uniref:alkene reductase n=1 Tax=Luteimonas sp. MC1750 TaxID=2799326 RepID=UPI0018F09FC7|nr:alkene reductase [Luteimonas sp. MC1750]MBJ6985021.1 alkene reductase [Luteimonas sp. MC1750]QQO05689.1 alkene reductase [Luteimonas sp. MC1750]
MSSLFNHYDLAGLALRNRIVMAPMTRSRAVTTVPDALTATYYAQRASAGLIVTEGAQVSEQARGYLFTPGLHSRAQVAGWKSVTDAVHAKGGAVFAQLWHVGRLSHVSLQPGERAPVAPVAKAAAGVQAFGYREDGTPGQMPASTPRALGAGEIPGITADFVAAARNAVDAGFDGIEIHGANGYLFEQFINGGLNTRDDAYGGSIANRLRFVLETVDAVVAAIGSQRVGIRLSPFNRIFDMPAFEDEADTWMELAHELAGRGLAYVHLSNREAILAAAGERFIREFRAAHGGTLILAGNYTRATAESDLAAGLADLVAFGRPFIANPDLVERLRNGWPLADADGATFYGGNATGYTDYPAYSEEIASA